VVRRQPLRALPVAAAALVAAVLAVGAAAPSVARAADAKVAIGHYRWSHPVVHVDLGQHVTWYWVGPDTMHSVTGISGNDLSDDSDRGRAEPDHTVGDHYRVTFTQPGVYQFQCKLHPIVHGEIIVSDVPGNPNDDPDPIPKPSVNLTRPTLEYFFLGSRRFGRTGTELHLALDDPSTVDAEVWRAGRHGQRTTYAGWRQWPAHIGFNELTFGVRSRHFRPAPGRYVAFVDATDMFANVSRTRTVHFTITAPQRRRH
jgi:plastocyanin